MLLEPLAADKMVTIESKYQFQLDKLKGKLTFDIGYEPSVKCCSLLTSIYSPGQCF